MENKFEAELSKCVRGFEKVAIYKLFSKCLLDKNKNCTKKYECSKCCSLFLN